MRAAFQNRPRNLHGAGTAETPHKGRLPMVADVAAARRAAQHGAQNRNLQGGMRSSIRAVPTLF